MLTVRNLNKRYGELVALRDVSFEVPRGSIFTIIGGSGSGKTTLLRHLIGLVEPMSALKVTDDLCVPKGLPRCAAGRVF